MRGIGRTPTDWLDLPPIMRGIGRTPTDWSYFPWAYWTNIPFTPPVNPTNLQTVDGGGDEPWIGTIHTSAYTIFWVIFPYSLWNPDIMLSSTGLFMKLLNVPETSNLCTFFIFVVDIYLAFCNSWLFLSHATSASNWRCQEENLIH